MIMHVVLESAEVSSCGLRNISRVAVHCIKRRAGDGRTIYNWGEPERAPHRRVECSQSIYGGIYIYILDVCRA